MPIFPTSCSTPREHELLSLARLEAQTFGDGRNVGGDGLPVRAEVWVLDLDDAAQGSDGLQVGAAQLAMQVGVLERRSPLIAHRQQHLVVQAGEAARTVGAPDHAVEVIVR